MTLIEAFNILKTSIENTAIAAVKTLKAHTFKADIGEKSFEVTNFPKTQQIEGKVAVTNQQDLEKQLRGVNDWLRQVMKTLDTLKPKEEIRVTNFPKIEFPAFPKEMKVKDSIDVSEKSFKAVLEALQSLTALVKQLPTKYPEVKIPPFPRIPDFPEIPRPAPFPKSFSVDNLEQLKSDDPKKYVPVRLSDGQRFYQAIEELSIAAGRSYAYSDSQGAKQQALVDSDRHVQADIVGSLDAYQINDKLTDGNTTYTGNESAEGDWYIMKVVSGTTGRFRYATHKNNPTINTYTGAWNNKSSLTYGYYSQAFGV